MHSAATFDSQPRVAQLRTQLMQLSEVERNKEFTRESPDVVPGVP